MQSSATNNAQITHRTAGVTVTSDTVINCFSLWLLDVQKTVLYRTHTAVNCQVASGTWLWYCHWKYFCWKY